jgi:hypothetical protein
LISSIVKDILPIQIWRLPPRLILVARILIGVMFAKELGSLVVLVLLSQHVMITTRALRMLALF